MKLFRILKMLLCKHNWYWADSGTTRTVQECSKCGRIKIVPHSEDGKFK